MLTRIIMLLSSVVVAANPESTSRLIISSYTGSVSAIDICHKPEGLIMKTTSINHNCGVAPSWLTFDAKQRLLYCLNEGDSQTASITSMNVSLDGRLMTSGNKTVHTAPVSGQLFSRKNGTNKILVAHYSPGAVSSIDTSELLKESLVQTLQFPNNGSKVVPDRQAGSNAHQVLLDPTEKFVLVPDLGADSVHVLSINEDGHLNELASLFVPGGTGPRHGVFWSQSSGAPSSQTKPVFYMVVGELSAMIHVYRVKYLGGNKGLSFDLVDTTSALIPRPITTFYPAEITVSPDNRFVMISNRQDESSTATLGGSGPPIVSDTLSNFQINYDSDSNSVKLALVQSYPAGGLNPRHFAFNRDGSLVAVPLLSSAVVAVISRDVETGLLQRILIRHAVEGKPTSVVWDE